MDIRVGQSGEVLGYSSDGDLVVQIFHAFSGRDVFESQGGFLALLGKQSDFLEAEKIVECYSKAIAKYKELQEKAIVPPWQPMEAAPVDGELILVFGYLRVQQVARSSPEEYLVYHNCGTWFVQGSYSDHVVDPIKWRSIKIGGSECQ